MRSTQELREEIFRRAEHKKRAKRALYRRMGTLCLLLCLCTGVMVWGMLGQTAPEAGSSHSVTESSHGELLLPSESIQSGNTVSIDQAGQDQQTSAPMEAPEENFSAEESASAGESVSDEEIVPPEESAPSEESDAAEGYDPEWESPSEDEFVEGLPTVLLLQVSESGLDGEEGITCTVLGLLNQSSDINAGSDLRVDLPSALKLYGGESILATGTWEDGVFVIDGGDYLLFCDEAEEDGDLPADEGDPPCEDPGLLPPESSSVLIELLAEAGKFPVKDTSTRAALELFCALEQLYDEYGG